MSVIPALGKIIRKILEALWHSLGNSCDLRWVLGIGLETRATCLQEEGSSPVVAMSGKGRRGKEAATLGVPQTAGPQ
jgi:hypothetical protein